MPGFLGKIGKIEKTYFFSENESYNLINKPEFQV